LGTGTLHSVNIPVPEKLNRERIQDMAARKLLRLEKRGSLPEASLSVCDRPPCIFKGCCHSPKPFEPNWKTGFVQWVEK
jgi:hypothetical protein